MLTSTASPSRIALVTGGTRRIGGAIAHALAQAGFAVAMHARERDSIAEDAVKALARGGATVALCTGDLSHADTPARLVAEAAAIAGPLTLLVNCAASFESDAVETLDPDTWDRQFAVNLRAPVLLAQAFARQAPAGASIVNITDQRVRRPVPRHFSYTLSKCALDAATTMLAQALAPRIRVNAVAPGPTLPSPRQSAASFAQQETALPLEHGPRPEDIGRAVLYLADSHAITGETIMVDGGQHIAWKTPDVWGIEE